MTEKPVHASACECVQEYDCLLQSFYILASLQYLSTLSEALEAQIALNISAQLTNPIPDAYTSAWLSTQQLPIESAPQLAIACRSKHADLWHSNVAWEI